MSSATAKGRPVTLPVVAKHSRVVSKVMSEFKTLFQNRAKWHGLTDSFEITTEDTDSLLAFADVYFPRTDWHAFEQFFLCLASNVLKNIASYGNDGNGNKPVGMNRVEYWCAHIDSELIEQATTTLAARPAEDIVFEADKPPSSAPKCKVCKGKFAKGSLGIKKRIVRPVMNPVHDKTPMWNILTNMIVCNHPKCRARLSLKGKPVLEGVSEAHRVDAEALADEAVA